MTTNPSDLYVVPFTKSKWTHNDLDGESVEFRWTYNGQIAEGIGKFLVRDNGEGLAIEILILCRKDESTYTQHRLALQQQNVDKIEINSESQQAKYRMMA